jgi:hypothetical protein
MELLKGEMLQQRLTRGLLDVMAEVEITLSFEDDVAIRATRAQTSQRSG